MTDHSIRIGIDPSGAEDGAKRVVQAEQAIVKGADEAGAAVQKLDKAQEELADSAKQAQQAEESAAKATKATGDAATVAAQKTGQLVDQQGRAREANSRYVTGAQQATRATNELGQAQQTATRTSLNFGRAFAGIFAGFSGAAVIRSATRELTDLGNVRAKLSLVTGGNNDPLGFTALAEQAESFKTRSTVAVTSAQLEIARAGYTAAQTLKILPATLDLVTAAELEAGQAAQIVSNTLGQFGKAASEAADVVDALVTTADRSTTNVNELAEALKIAGPIAATLKVPLNELLGVLGAISKSARGAEAGTGVRGVIASLLDPSAEGIRVLKELGLTVQDVNPEVVGLTNALELLRTRGLSDTQAVQLFRREAFTVGTVLTQTTAAARENTKAISENAGIAKKYGQELDATLGGALRELDANYRKLIDSAGDKGLTSALKGLVGVASDSLKVMRGGTTESKAYDIALKGLLSTITALIALRFAVALGTWAVGLRAVTTATTAANGASVLLSRTLLLNPWVAATAGAIGLAVVLKDLATQSKLTREEIDRMNERTTKLSSADLKPFAQALPITGLTGEPSGLGAMSELLLKKVRGQLAEIGKFDNTGFGGTTVDEAKFQALRNTVSTLFRSLQGNTDPAAKALADTIKTKFIDAIDKSGLRDDLKDKFQQEFQFATKGVDVAAEVVAPTIDQAAVGKADAFMEALREELALAGATNEEREYATAISKAATVATEAYGFATDAANQYLEEFGDTLDEIVAKQKADNEQKALAVLSEKRLGDARQAQQGLIGLLRNLAEEEALLGASNEQKKVAAEVTKAAALAEVAFGGNLAASSAFLKDYEARLKGLANAYEGAARAKRTADLEKDITELGARRATLGLSKEEQGIQEQLRAFKGRALEAFGNDADSAAAATARFEKELRGLVEAEKEWARIQEIADGTANALGQSVDGLVDSLLEGKDAFVSIQEAAAGFVKEIVKGVFSTLVTQPLVEKTSEGLKGVLGDFFGPDKGNPLQDGLKGATAIQTPQVTITAQSVSVGGGTANGLPAGLSGGNGGGGGPGLPVGFGSSSSGTSPIGGPSSTIVNGTDYFGQTPAQAAGQNGAASQSLFALTDPTSANGLTGLGTTLGVLGGAGSLAGGLSAASGKESTAGKVAGGAQAAGGLLMLLGLIPGLQFLLPFGLALSVGGGIGGSFFNAKGNAFRGTQVVPFADGGVLDRPVSFPLAGSKIGVAGEAGHEAIMPLKRGKDGKLGVAGGGVTNVYLTQNIQTPDAPSFRRSQSHIGARAQADARKIAARR